jgi:hypothetical protein
MEVLMNPARTLFALIIILPLAIQSTALLSQQPPVQDPAGLASL